MTRTDDPKGLIQGYLKYDAIDRVVKIQKISRTCLIEAVLEFYYDESYKILNYSEDPFEVQIEQVKEAMEDCRGALNTILNEMS